MSDSVSSGLRIGTRALSGLGSLISGDREKKGSLAVGCLGIFVMLFVLLVVPLIIFLCVPQAMASAILTDDPSAVDKDVYQLGLDEVSYYQGVEQDFKDSMVSRYGEGHTVLNQPNWRYFAVVDTLLYQNDPDKAKAMRADTDKWIMDNMLVSYETKQESHTEQVKDPKTGKQSEKTVTADVTYTIVTYPELMDLLSGREITWEIIPGQKVTLDDEAVGVLVDANWTMLMSYTGDLNLGPTLGNFFVSADAMSDPVFARLMAEATKYIGYPYVYGGSSPATSFDCSGFVCWVYTHSGVYNLPRTTAQGIYEKCVPVTYDQLRPGDLVFFQGTYDFYETITHVGIYVGNNTMLQAGDPIGYADLRSDYWKEHWYSGGRLV